MLVGRFQQAKIWHKMLFDCIICFTVFLKNSFKVSLKTKFLNKKTCTMQSFSEEYLNKVFENDESK